MHCKVTGGERIIWRKNGKQLNSEVTDALNSPSLQFKKLNRLDKGNFTCETSLENITARSSILRLDVQGKSYQFYFMVLIIVVLITVILIEYYKTYFPWSYHDKPCINVGQDFFDGHIHIIV